MRRVLLALIPRRHAKEILLIQETHQEPNYQVLHEVTVGALNYILLIASLNLEFGNLGENCS